MTEITSPTTTARFETRFPCPVCLVMMEKTRLQGSGPRGMLTLDHCERCGGVWFERGEVTELASRSPTELWAQIAPRTDRPRPPCHNCQTPLDRDAERCAVCGKSNEINCPVCDQKMGRRKIGDLTLDVCAHCRGVWFDHAELTAIWSASFRAAAESASDRPGAAGQAMAVGADVLMDAMIWSPGLVADGAVAAVHFGGAAAEVVGSAAESVFETILGFISALFDGS